MRCLVNSDPMFRLNNAQVNIGLLWTFLGGHREVFFDTCKDVFEEVDAGVGTHEVIYGSSNY